MPLNRIYSIKIMPEIGVADRVSIEVCSPMPLDKIEFACVLQDLIGNMPRWFDDDHKVARFAISKQYFSEYKDELINIMERLCSQGYLMKENVETFNQQAKKVIADMGEIDSSCTFKYSR